MSSPSEASSSPSIPTATSPLFITPPTCPPTPGMSSDTSVSDDSSSPSTPLTPGSDSDRSYDTARTSLDSSCEIELPRPVCEVDILTFTGSMKYDASEPLGTGCWSKVYRAWSLEAKGAEEATSTTEKPAKAFAVKLPVSASARRTLRHEARMLTYFSRQPHCNIIRFFGLNPVDHSLVLPYYPSTLESFTQSIDHLPVPERSAILAVRFPRLVEGTCAALAYLKRVGVVHGDVKPSNILLGPTNDGIFYDVVLADFSSATFAPTPNPSSAATDPALPLLPVGAGTTDFLHPRLLRSPFAAPTPTTDLYSLAVTLLHCLAGGLSFLDAIARGRAPLKREVCRQGRVLHAALGEPAAEARLRAVERSLYWRAEADAEAEAEADAGSGSAAAAAAAAAPFLPPALVALGKVKVVKWLAEVMCAPDWMRDETAVTVERWMGDWERARVGTL